MAGPPAGYLVSAKNVEDTPAAVTRVDRIPAQRGTMAASVGKHGVNSQPTEMPAKRQIDDLGREQKRKKEKTTTYMAIVHCHSPILFEAFFLKTNL